MEQFDANFRPRDETLNEVKILPKLILGAVFLAWDVKTVSTRRCLFFSQGQDESLRQNHFSWNFTEMVFSENVCETVCQSDLAAERWCFERVFD